MSSKIKATNSQGKTLTIENIDSVLDDVSITSKDLAGIKSVDTLADLRTMKIPVEKIWVSGYHTKNDGAFGSHIFRLKGVKTTETDNSGTVIIATIGGVDYVYELQFDGAVNVKWFGAVGDGSDETIAIQSALDLKGYIQLDAYKEYGITTVSYPSDLQIGSDTTFDLNGSTLKRIGANISNKIITNTNHNSGTANTNITIKNGSIEGTGVDTTGVSGQGACISLVDVDGFLIEDISTINSNGDGIHYSRANNGVLRNISIGNFGRNGISPTSGLNNYWENVSIDGTPFIGSDPGIPIDIENNADTEWSSHTWNNVTASYVVFVDFHTAALGTYAHSLVARNCTFGSDSRYISMKIYSTNPTTSPKFILDSTNIFNVGGGDEDRIGVYLKNVSNISINNDFTIVDDFTGRNRTGIQLLGVIENFSSSSSFDDRFLYGIRTTEGSTNNSIFSNSNSPRLQLIGSNNKVYKSNIGTMVISGIASIDNIIGKDVKLGALSYINSADSTLNPLVTASANTSGSFIPYVYGTTTAGTATYSTRLGFYSRVDNIITFTLTVTYTSHTGTGDIYIDISDIGYDSADAYKGGRCVFTVFHSSIANSLGPLMAKITNNSNLISIRQVPFGGNDTPVSIDATGALQVSGSYFIN